MFPYEADREGPGNGLISIFFVGNFKNFLPSMFWQQIRSMQGSKNYIIIIGPALRDKLLIIVNRLTHMEPVANNTKFRAVVLTADKFEDMKGGILPTPTGHSTALMNIRKIHRKDDENDR